MQARASDAICVDGPFAGREQGALTVIPYTIAQGPATVLRDRCREDLDTWVKWQTGGIWRQFDAPWEALGFTPTPERVARLRSTFVELLEAELPAPRQEAIIATTEGRPVGWIRRYGEQRFPDSWSLGIGIGEDDCIGKGHGTEALGLWIDHLFGNSSIHRLALTTYSFNGRMMHVAEKVGMVNEGTEREVVLWEGLWRDRVRYSLLRQEWEARTRA